VSRHRLEPVEDYNAYQRYAIELFLWCFEDAISHGNRSVEDVVTYWTQRTKDAGLQLRTVKELMEGKGIERPTSATSLDDTFKKAPESKKKQGQQTELGV
jgi:hypothetical protein